MCSTRIYRIGDDHIENGSAGMTNSEVRYAIYTGGFISHFLLIYNVSILVQVENRVRYAYDITVVDTHPQITTIL